jgi:eukaryotic-like serine/threonine-protein kinase
MKIDFKKFKSNTLGGLLLNLLVAGGILVVISILYFYAYLPAITNHNDSITVPNIEGMQISELEDMLVKRNLRFEVNDSSYSADYPPLTVLKQFPAAGSKVKEDRNISISVNRIKPPTVPVPNLLDGSVVNADAVLRSNELKRGRIELVSGPFNIVKEMKFKGAKIEPLTRVPKGSVIDLVVMDGGGGAFPTPDVIGLNLEDAKVPILGSYLSIEVILVGDTLGTNAVIIKQKPLPEENIKAGDVVELWIAKPGTEAPSDDEEEEEE